MKIYRNVLAALLMAASFSAMAAPRTLAASLSAMAAPRTYEVTFAGEAPVRVSLGDSDLSNAVVTSHAVIDGKPAGIVALSMWRGEVPTLHLVQRWVELESYVHGDEYVTIPDQVTSEYDARLPELEAKHAQVRFENRSPAIVISRVD